ncbi:MAG: HDOD domain-containing protein [candidate division Zixibacteria bacterium]|nr:HDOD domain-containing protein [candidate division Zixibacteria bacterium]
MTQQLIDSGIEEKISKVVGGISNLPTPPIVFSQIQKVLSNPNTSAFDIAAIIQEDPAISAKVLKLTNSAYYGLPSEIESVKQAVVIVGLEAVKNLVLSASVFEAFSKGKLDKEFQDVFWRHSLGVAFAARLLAHTLKSKMMFDAEAAFSAGMLHDIGKMVISVYMPDDFAKINELREQKPNTPDHVLEEEVLGYNHMQIGALLGKEWKLPAKLIEAISFHHFPQLNESENSLPFLIHMGNYLTHFTFDSEPDSEISIEPVAEGVVNFVGTSIDQLNGCADLLREEYGKSETFMEMAKGM